MKSIFIYLLFIESICFGYFNADLNYTVGKNDFNQNEINLTFSRKDWWIRTFYYSWENKDFNRFNSFGIKWGSEKPTYTLSFLGGYSPENNSYENVSIGADITFSLKPSNKKDRKIAGPNSGFIRRSNTGISRFDLGTQIVLTAHRYEQTEIDLREINTTFFGGFKFFLTNLSFSYSFSSYDKNNIAISYAPPLQKIYGLNSVFPVFMKSNFNTRLEIVSEPIITPYLSYNRFKSKSNENMNIYSIGSYIDLAMLGLDFRFEIYKDFLDKLQRYLSISLHLRF